MNPCDSALFRRTIGHFASGVAVITTSHGGRDFGMTASAVTSLSLEPPMLVICVNRNAPTHQAISESDRFAVNVLARSQQQLAFNFARPAEDKFAGVKLRQGQLGLPLLVGCVANFECAVTSVTTGGTHTIFIAEVLTAIADEHHDPLLYYRGRFGRLRLADDLIEAAENGPGTAWSDWASEMFRAV